MPYFGHFSTIPVGLGSLKIFLSLYGVLLYYMGGSASGQDESNPAL